MLINLRAGSSLLALCLLLLPAQAQTAGRDGIADILSRGEAHQRLAQGQPAPQKGLSPRAQQPPAIPAPPTGPTALAVKEPETPDPRQGDAAFEQAQRLMKAIDAILQDTAKNRGEARKLPADNDFLLKPLWTETREDREKKIRELLDAALGIVTDVPVVDVQKKIETLRKNIRELDDRIVKLREKQLVAPKDGVLPGYVTDTVDSLGQGHRGLEEAHRGQQGRDRARPRPTCTTRSRKAASTSRPSRSTCCSTACCRVISCGSSPCSTRPRSSTVNSPS